MEPTRDADRRCTLTRAARRLQKTRNRRAACPLPQLSGRGILEAVRDASTSFALLTSRRMTVSADRAARVRSLLRSTSNSGYYRLSTAGLPTLIGLPFP